MKVFVGKVLHKNNEKTAMVVVERVVIHPIYKKRVRVSKKYQVHDELGAETGNRVKFIASKPYSRAKKWKIIEVINEDKKLVKRVKKA